MKYYLSAFRNSRHPDGHVVAGRVPVDSIEDAMEWIYTNMFHARTDHAVVRFDAIADRNGIAELIAEYEGEWSKQEFDQLNGIETVIIRRSDYQSDIDGK